MNTPLPHLETFAAAAELGSFTAAAQALGLTQAAVSQRIRALERALNVSLFRREGGHVFLSEAGQRLHPYAQRVVLLHQEARQEVFGRKATLTGELTLAASSVPGEHLLPPLLAAFHAKYPHIRTRMTVTDTSAVLEQLERGEANLGVVGGQTDSAHIVFRPFACDRLVLVVPADHPWRKRKRVSVAEMLRQPLVLREAGSGSRWCLERTLSRAGHSAKKLRVALELGSNEAIKGSAIRRNAEGEFLRALPQRSGPAASVEHPGPGTSGEAWECMSKVAPLALPGGPVNTEFALRRTWSRPQCPHSSAPSLSSLPRFGIQA